MNIDTQTWIQQVQRVRNNPAAIQQLALVKLERALNGQFDIVDPSNPFPFLLEASTANSAAIMQQAEVVLTRQYESMAATPEDLYLHMSDLDYLGRFASPASAEMQIMLTRDEIYRSAVASEVEGIFKLTIPRHTQFTVANTVFTMQYPIDIRVMAHGGLSIVYDVTRVSPLQSLATNVVEWSTFMVDTVEWVRIKIPVQQFEIQTHRQAISPINGVGVSYKFSNQFYYARAYYSTNNGWREMRTTHTDQVYDPLHPTCVLKVIRNEVQVVIPQIYLTTGMLNTELRLDIYTTKGPVELLLENYNAGQFLAQFRDHDSNESSTYSAALSSMRDRAIISTSVVSGGRNALTFFELRDRVMRNAMGATVQPITNAQVSARLSDMGYDMVVNVDNITNRQFLATRALPRPSDGSVVSGMGCTIQKLTTSLDALTKLNSVRDNGNRITLLPTTLYRILNGMLMPVETTEIMSLLALSTDVRARRVNEGNYLYSPFHYVADMNDDRFDLRGYYLDDPSVLNKTFEEENASTGLGVATAGYAIERTATGYRLVVSTRSTESFQALSNDDVFCQLSFTPVGQRDRAFLNGTLTRVLDTKERIYTFEINTNYDVTRFNELVLTSFQMYNDPARPHATPMTGDFDVTYSVRGIDTTDVTMSGVDANLGRTILPSDVVGVSQEKFTIRLGDSLDGLWSSSRSVVSEEDLMRHSTNVPAVYDSVVYKRDPVTGAIEMTMTDDGQIEFTVLHRKGDPILDANGDPINRFVIGDVMIDTEGKPIVKSSRKMLRQMDLLLVDGAYWFATDLPALTYRESVPFTINGWLQGDIKEASKNLLERTTLFYAPKSTLGWVSARVMEDATVSISAAQTFAVRYHLSAVAFRDAPLRRTLTLMTVEVINEILQKAVVTMDDIISTLRERAGGDIISVSATGLGGDASYDAVTLTDDSARLSIRKRLVARSDDTLGVEDDVDISFVRHTSM